MSDSASACERVDENAPAWQIVYHPMSDPRLARRGQSHAVEVYRLIARHTIDEQIAERCGQKVTAQQLILDYFA